ncbi:MAG TPA: CHAD domain-containing protein [Streptosporangiaceae bacterium]|nr:CHAD domain-containing protein [Streptosporangiaceae bacterium]
MTPDLRDFELDRRDGETQAGTRTLGAATASDPIHAVLEALAPAFGISEERGAPGSGTRRRTWLDTFDWRLERAGLELTYENARRGSRLLLTAWDGTPQAEQPAAGWQPRRPSLPQDLPPGPVRDRIVQLASPRALLPVVTTSTTISVKRLTNPDGKTVARLIVNASSLTLGGANPRTLGLPARLTIAEVRGYPAQARRAARLLAELPGVAPVTTTLLAEALRALGRRPADYTNGVDAEITAEMPAPVAVATVLLRLLDTLEQNTCGVLRDIDTEFLHDLRVSVRRTRAAIKLLGDVLPGDLAEQYGPEFAWLGDLTTPTRDLDVHLLGFPAMAEHLLAASPEDLEPFRAFLARRRSREFRLLATAMRSPRFRTLTDHWRKALVEVRDAAGPRRRRARQIPAADLAVTRTARAFGKVTSRGGAITAASAPESLHDLRKRCKELRYLLEFFAPLYDPVAYKKVVGDLKQLQDCLGDFQDSQIEREEIHALAEQMLAERAAPAATLLAMGEITAKLAIRQEQARADFGRRFAAFAGPEGQRRVRVLLERAGAP